MALEKNFDAASAETRLYKMWEKSGCFIAGANASRKDTFCIMLPPPNVTGHLHVGHAFNHTLMDILTRWKRMQGYDTLWQPGLDHAGIATQLMVEKQMAEDGENRKRSEMPRGEFLAKVWEWKGDKGGVIEQQARRLGNSMDWSRSAFTMSGAETAPQSEKPGNFHDAVLKVFVEMYNKGLVYRGKRLVNWDPHFETAISDLEVENIEVDGHMWHFKYPLAKGETYEYVEKDKDGAVILKETRDYISIATTRPETMLGDGAVAVHPSDTRYAAIVGKLCEIPLGPKGHRRLIPIITDVYPDPDFGSGAVKITGAHDFNDYQVAKRGRIPMYALMDTEGAMRSDGKAYAQEVAIAQSIANGDLEFDEEMIAAINIVPDDYRRLDRYQARKKVVADITAEGNAVMTVNPKAEEEGEQDLIPLVENKPIMQPFGDRSKVVIEPMLTDQWFVDSDKIVGPALDAVKSGHIKIMPESGEKIYYHWLENIEPWCISRQLWWGHQIPVWYDEDGNQYCAENQAAAQSMAGEATVLTRDPDVLDTWFSSGLWPIGTLGWPEKTEALEKYFATDVLITGQDILFFWVARMIMMQLAVVDEIPFHTVYLHQLVRDAKGEKMSKTRGNVIDPLDMIDTYGADALRMSNAAMAALGGVLKISEDRIKGYRNFGTKLWNASRFAEMNEAYDVPRLAVVPDIEAIGEPLNKWIIGETAKTRVLVDDALHAYRFNDAANMLYAFVWRKVCDWYVELSKPLLSGEDLAAKAETQATMAWVIDQCLVLLHPIMPFITEELWGDLSQRSKMLVHADWPTYGSELVDRDADREMNWVIALIEEIRSVRMQMHVPAGAKILMLVTAMDEQSSQTWDRNEVLIKKLARIDHLEKTPSFPKGCATLTVPGASFGLPLADIIDICEERARLQKSLDKLGKELGGLRGRLKNPKFIVSAPEDVVNETRSNLALREEEEAQMRAALGRLEELV
ncbi:MAG: valine--tRNA ligase [Paracoccaceae bacterium]|nr:valine--tRNA ligase [Paracoccaceae bacterium]